MRIPTYYRLDKYIYFYLFFNLKILPDNAVEYYLKSIFLLIIYEIYHLLYDL